MSLYRIKKKKATRAVAAGGDSFQDYLDRLMRMIPGDVVGLYLLGSGFIPASESIGLLVWAIVCLIAVVILRIKYTQDPPTNPDPQWASVVISAISFVIWVYTLGGPFEAWDLAVPWIGSLLVLAWTFFLPLFYKGD